MRRLEDIMNALQDNTAVTPKTASVKDVITDATPDLGAKMLETVRALTDKTASAQTSQPSGNAVEALGKIAADVADAQDAAMRKLAELSGAAMCDGFMARLAAYDTAIGTKTASVDVEKIAAEAYVRGIEAGRAELEKQAAEAYALGYQQQMQEIHKIASEVHLAGQQSARNVLVALQQQGR